MGDAHECGIEAGALQFGEPDGFGEPDERGQQ